MVGYPGGARGFDPLKNLSYGEMKELSKDAATAAVISHGQFSDASAAAEYFFNAYFKALDLFRIQNKFHGGNELEFGFDEDVNAAKFK